MQCAVSLGCAVTQMRPMTPLCCAAIADHILQVLMICTCIPVLVVSYSCCSGR